MRRIRLRFGVLLAVFAAFTGYAGEGLLDFVPAGVEYVVGVRAESLRKLAPFREAAEAGTEAENVFSQFEKDYHLRFADCRELLFVGGRSPLRGLLAKVALPEAELARHLRSFGDRFSLAEEAGRKIYCIRTDPQTADEAMEVGISFLAPDVVLAAERGHVAPFLAAIAVPKGGEKSRLTAPEGEPLVWSFLDVKARLAKPGKQNPDDLGHAMLQGLNSVSAELTATEDGGEWKLDAFAQCDDEGSAQQFALRVPFGIQLGASLLFADDPALGAEFLKQLKVAPDGRRVVLELALSRSLAERLARYLGEQAKKRIIPPDPVPPDLRTRRPEDKRD